jgi:DNA-binding NarL/FixJ family response regulator
MTNSRLQLDFAPQSLAELRETLRQVLPFLEKLLPVARDFCEQKVRKPTSTLCDSCIKKVNCTEPCKDIKKLLPKVNSGRSCRENRRKFYDNTLQEMKKVKRLETFEQYEKCNHLFTDKQYVAVYLYFHDGKTQQEIANELNKAVSTVSEHLKKAEKRKEEHDRKLRAERLEYLKKININDP